MKILHTADWHIGKMINGQSLLEDQKYVLQALFEDIDKHKPDMVIISGDLYDLHYPNKEAMMVLEDALATINLKLNIPIVAISGNHDGRERLNYGELWFQKYGLKIVTDFNNITEPIVVDDVCFYVLPYFTPADIRSAFNVRGIHTHQEATTFITNKIKKTLNENKTNVLVGHLFVDGGDSSDSERPLSIGTIETVSASTFNGFDVVMLGHLHHPFAINSEFIFYSGSLMQYSFSEQNQAKGYRLFEFGDESFSQQFIPIKPSKSFHVIDAQYEDVINEKLNIENKNDYFHFRLSGMDHITDPLMKIRDIYPNTLQLSRQDYNISQDEIKLDIKALQDIDIIKSFYKHVTNEDLKDVKEKKVNQLLEKQLNKGGDE